MSPKREAESPPTTECRRSTRVRTSLKLLSKSAEPFNTSTPRPRSKTKVHKSLNADTGKATVTLDDGGVLGGSKFEPDYAAQHTPMCTKPNSALRSDAIKISASAVTDDSTASRAKVEPAKKTRTTLPGSRQFRHSVVSMTPPIKSRTPLPSAPMSKILEVSLWNIQTAKLSSSTTDKKSQATPTAKKSSSSKKLKIFQAPKKPRGSKVSTRFKNEKIKVDRNGNPFYIWDNGRIARNSAGKHGTVAPPKTIFIHSENTHISHDKAKFGMKDTTKVKLKLVTSQGNVAVYRFPDLHDHWDDPRWVADVNKWRVQTFRRLFSRDPAFIKNQCRAKWSMEEFEDFKKHLMKRVKKIEAYPGLIDFKKLAHAHNKIWGGKTMKAGVPIYKGIVAKKDQVINRRTGTGCQQMWIRDKELNAEVKALADTFKKVLGKSKYHTARGKQKTRKSLSNTTPKGQASVAKFHNAVEDWLAHDLAVAVEVDDENSDVNMAPSGQVFINHWTADNTWVASGNVAMLANDPNQLGQDVVETSIDHNTLLAHENVDNPDVVDVTSDEITVAQDHIGPSDGSGAVAPAGDKNPLARKNTEHYDVDVTIIGSDNVASVADKIVLTQDTVEQSDSGELQPGQAVGHSAINENRLGQSSVEDSGSDLTEIDTNYYQTLTADQNLLAQDSTDPPAVAKTQFEQDVDGSSSEDNSLSAKSAIDYVLAKSSGLTKEVAQEEDAHKTDDKFEEFVGDEGAPGQVIQRKEMEIEITEDIRKKSNADLTDYLGHESSDDGSD